MAGHAHQVVEEGTSAPVQPPGVGPTAQCVQWTTVLSVLNRERGVECVTMATAWRTPPHSAVSGSTLQYTAVTALYLFNALITTMHYFIPISSTCSAQYFNALYITIDDYKQLSLLYHGCALNNRTL